MKIIIEVAEFEGGLTSGEDMEQQTMRVTQLLRDALGEFVKIRTPVYEYMRERYEGNAQLNTAEKRREVIHRCAVAEQLKRGHVTITSAS